MGTWRSIDSAPKDGRSVHVKFFDGTTGVVTYKTGEIYSWHGYIKDGFVRIEENNNFDIWHLMNRHNETIPPFKVSSYQLRRGFIPENLICEWYDEESK